MGTLAHALRIDFRPFRFWQLHAVANSIRCNPMAPVWVRSHTPYASTFALFASGSSTPWRIRFGATRWLPYGYARTRPTHRLSPFSLLAAPRRGEFDSVQPDGSRMGTLAHALRIDFRPFHFWQLL